MDLRRDPNIIKVDRKKEHAMYVKSETTWPKIVGKGEKRGE